MVATSPVTPPTMCTGPEPAMSIIPVIHGSFYEVKDIKNNVVSVTDPKRYLHFLRINFMRLWLFYLGLTRRNRADKQ